jgi:hypothetical protein
MRPCRATLGELDDAERHEDAAGDARPPPAALTRRTRHQLHGRDQEEAAAEPEQADVGDDPEVLQRRVPHRNR